jgi:hypothetical protein
MFAPLVHKCVVVYLDDILIYSRTEEEHLAHLKQVLQILRENQFYAKLKKCTFFQPETLFLGHVVGRDGIKPDPAKVTAVKGWPVPQTVTDVRSFLGLTNYFRRFNNHQTLTNPLLSGAMHRGLLLVLCCFKMTSLWLMKAGRCRLRRETMVLGNRSCWQWFMRSTCGAVILRGLLSWSSLTTTPTRSPHR